MWSAIFDLAFPPRKTEKLLRRISPQELRSIEQEAGLPYHDPRVTALVWELKYYAHARAAALAGELLSQRLLAVAAEELGTPLLVPVPMHAARLRERGHNQTEVLCKAALAHLEGAFAYEPDILLRTRATAMQQGLPKYERLRNIDGSMVVKDPVRVADRVCVVVDDVETTGATLREARRALKEAGARRVHALALAHS